MIINFATGNASKVHSMQRHLEGFGITVKQVDLPLIEPQADTVEEIALSKAKQAYDILKAPVVVEDGSFGLDALNGFPGPYIKYTLETIGAEGLLQLATVLKSRRCRFTSALTYMDVHGNAKVFTEDYIAGTLADTIAEENVQGAWSDLWRIFIPDGASQALSALTEAERNRIFAGWQADSKFTKFGEWLVQHEG